MKISLNDTLITLPENSSLAYLLQQENVQAPFAVAINTAFIAKQKYAETVLQEGDKVDVVKPVAGG